MLDGLTWSLPELWRKQRINSRVIKSSNSCRLRQPWEIGDKLNGLCISQICWMLGSHLKNGRFPDAEWVDSSHTEVAQTMQKEE
ncbi:hypothetical protein AV530_010511 [Patagioenas fasciata monilis]|uniref:Uncharacterized protein n=1 Tax=Patagioenas fasciata monilis TaxID=372326 RepID=A0A1V4KF44_PATFA|nr:hypothetical protein AV530_010511 [Patagioenas fasciata monilis]